MGALRAAHPVPSVLHGAQNESHFMERVHGGLTRFLPISLLLFAENATSVTPTPAEVSVHRGTKAPSREMPDLWAHKHRAAPHYHTAKLQQFQTSSGFLHPCKDLLLKVFETTANHFSFCSFYFSFPWQTRALFPSWKPHLRAHGPSIQGSHICLPW